MTDDWDRCIGDSIFPNRSKVNTNATLFEMGRKPVTSQLLMCKNCSLCVHAACYDVVNIKNLLDWLCDKCAALDSPLKKVNMKVYLNTLYY